MNVANMVGIGPFITIPGFLAAMHGPQALIAWVIAAGLVICDGLVWSELGAALPGSGGTYHFLHEIFGEHRVAEPGQREVEEVVAVVVHPALGVEARGGRRRRDRAVGPGRDGGGIGMEAGRSHAAGPAIDAASVRSERLIRELASGGSDPRGVGADAAPFEARRSQLNWAR